MEILETTQFALLRIASVVCVPLALFAVVTTVKSANGTHTAEAKRNKAN